MSNNFDGKTKLSNLIISKKNIHVLYYKDVV